MKWSEFNDTCEEYFCTFGSTFYHRVVALNSAKVVTFFAYKVGISPNMTTALSSLMAVSGMGILIWKPDSLVIGLCNLVLLQLCFILDCADGILARLQGKSSSFGWFLDIFLDRFNNFVVFACFGFAWVIASPSKPSLFSVAIYISAASAYILYTIVSMIRGFVFPNLKGTIEEFGKPLGEKILKFPYQFMNMGVHFLLLSLAHIAGLIYAMVIFYGILGSSITIAMIVYLYLKDAKKMI